jgi:hemerythrin-like domain-containing protein
VKEQMRRPIKEVIAEYPAVGTALDEFDIGCFPCAVGTCLLGDVVSIHGLSPEQEKELMGRIGEIIHGGGTNLAAAAPAPSPRAAAPKTFKYSPPVKTLVDEHLLIKRFIALVPDLLAALDLHSEEGRQVVLNGVDFIRTYADAFHHAKEEDILFGYAEGNQEVIQVMLEDHTVARAHVKSIVEGVTSQDEATVSEHLQAYAELLTEHIKREDEILYPWMDRTLSTKQVGELYAAFAAADAKADSAAIERCQRFVEELEVSLSK